MSADVNGNEASEASVPISFRIPKSLDDQIKQLAAQRFGQKSDIVKEALADYMRVKGLMIPENSAN